MKPKNIFPSLSPNHPCSRALCLGTLLVIWPFTAFGQAADNGKITATASSWEQKAKGGFGDFPPEATLDGKLTPDSSWRAEGDGQWIQYDLGSIKNLGFVDIAFVGGNNRVYTFDVLVSKTGRDSDWIPAAQKVTSSGTTQAMETFKFTPIDARYVRLVGHGNTSKQFPNWFNIIEVSFTGLASSPAPQDNAAAKKDAAPASGH